MTIFCHGRIRTCTVVAADATPPSYGSEMSGAACCTWRALLCSYQHLVGPAQRVSSRDSALAAVLPRSLGVSAAVPCYRPMFGARRGTSACQGLRAREDAPNSAVVDAAAPADGGRWGASSVLGQDRRDGFGIF